MREYFDQIIGYYILYRLGGISGIDGDYKINKIGIYFSRFAYLYLVDIKDIIDDKRFPDFLRWFIKYASKIYRTKEIGKELEEKIK